MPFDGLALYAVARELRETLLGGRIDKIQQPERDEIVLHLRNRYESYRLLLSASSFGARVHCTRQTRAQPRNAPMFCMLLRKRLTSGRILDVRTHGMDRIFEMDISALDELGLESHYTLICECMGRHSNIVLLDAQGTIIDAIKHIDETQSRVREVLPALRYCYPPAQPRLNAAECSAQALQSALQQGSGPLSQRLCEALQGFSRPTGQEFVAACNLEDTQTNEEACFSLAHFTTQRVQNEASYAALLLRGETEEADFYPLASPVLGDAQPCETLSQAIENACAARDLHQRLRQKSATMTQVLHQALQRAQRKGEKQAEELQQAGHLEEDKLRAELLTANLYQLKKGQRQAEVLNYYDPQGAMLTVDLDVRLTPQQNAQAYYRKYNKAKATLQKLQAHYAQTQLEIDYLQTQLYNLQACSDEAALEEIRSELLAQGYLRQARQTVKKQLQPSKPLHFLSDDGFDIYVGRNNLQNDALTLRFARGEDIWLHTKNIPGSHVILRCAGRTPSDSALAQAALLAAWYSQGRASSHVAVDYTQKRNVKKPAGARPGYVIYTTNQTLYPTPDADAVSAIATVAQ